MFGEIPFCIGKTDRKEHGKLASIHGNLVPKTLPSTDYKTLKINLRSEKNIWFYMNNKVNNKVIWIIKQIHKIPWGSEIAGELGYTQSFMTYGKESW